MTTDLNTEGLDAGDLDAGGLDAGGLDAGGLDAGDLDERGPLGDPEAERTTSVALFDGDDGRLDFEQRRVLVLLLKERFVAGRKYPREWQVLLGSERVLGSRLNELFLELVVDREREVAYKRDAQPEAGEWFPTLLRDTSWNREETIAMVFLRDRHFAERAKGETQVWVDEDEVVEHVLALRPPQATDHAGDEARARNAVAALHRAGLLAGDAGSRRYEVSGAVETLLPLEKLVELLDWLRAEQARAAGELPPAEPRERLDPEAEAAALLGADGTEGAEQEQPDEPDEPLAVFAELAEKEQQ